MIRRVCPDDAGAIADIYGYYVKNTAASFEDEPPAADEILRRIETYSKNYPYYVFEHNGEVIGYCYASPFKSRAGYAPTAQLSIYIKNGYTGRGYGRQLATKLLASLKDMGYHNALASVTSPNPASEGLWVSLGFVLCAEMKDIGFKLGHWRTVRYYYLKLIPCEGEPQTVNGK